MATTAETLRGEELPRAGTREIAVWDPLVRLVHWGVALAILLNGAILDPEGKFHPWVGYVAAGLVVTRLVWGLVGTRHARFSAFPPSPRAVLRHLREMRAGESVVHLSHNPLGALMAYNLWACVLGLGVTGYMMGTNAFFGVEWVEELHEAIFNWLVLSVVLHVGGVAFESWRSGINLVRAMIDGRKRIPLQARIEE
ncbi:MAG: cytochrome B [Alphaproteobacteria bacterium]|nr:MAG: cytochrome B [Alphaproteobacteria bacterium]